MGTVLMARTHPPAKIAGRVGQPLEEGRPEKYGPARQNARASGWQAI